jgi:glutamate-5-semialdehyde dehydrogenase
MTIQMLLERAKVAASKLALLSEDEKNHALHAMADQLIANEETILAANAEDLAQAETNGMNPVMMDRLRLTSERIAGMAQGIREVAALPDPVGLIKETVVRPNGMTIQKVRAPMGVVAIIYESRPNVTSDAAALALKSGNVCVLRGGKEAFRTSYTILTAMRRGLASLGLPETLINMLEDVSRAGATELMTATDYVDLLIPRGGAGLIRACVENAKVPCIQTGTGICHIYVDDSADLQMALNILENAKTSRPSVCNAAEVCLVHKDVAPAFLPMLKKRLTEDREAAGLPSVELRLDARSAEIISGTVATDVDFDTEFLNYILAVAVVDSHEDAVAHIAKHSTHHSEAIITNDRQNAAYFSAAVDSAAVYVNASTRFTDGGEFGLGCEIGISTQKLHARGPMGLCELTTYKYVISGEGQIR